MEANMSGAVHQSEDDDVEMQDAPKIIMSGQYANRESNLRDVSDDLSEGGTQTSVGRVASHQAGSNGWLLHEEFSRHKIGSSSRQSMPEELLRPEQLRSHLNNLRGSKSGRDTSSAEYVPSRSSELALALDDVDAISVDGETAKLDSTAVLTMDSVRSILENSMTAANSHHALLVRNWMGRARVSVSATEKPQNVIRDSCISDAMDIANSDEAVSPFSNLVALESNDQKVVLCTYYHNGDSRHAHSQQILYQDRVFATSYCSKEVDTPRHRIIQPFGKNLVALNEKRLIVYPSFEDVFGGPMTAAEEQKLEQLEEKARRDLRRHYGHGQPETRPPVLWRRIHARQYRTHIERFLSQMGCGIEDLVRFMIRTNTLEIPSRSRAKWKIEAAKMPPHNESQNRRFRIVCEVFERFCGYSLWHVLKVTRTFHDLFIARPQMLASVPPTKGKECYSCHMHDCPFHGETIEDSPRQQEGSSDIDDERVARASNTDTSEAGFTSKVDSEEDEANEAKSIAGTVLSDSDSNEDTKSRLSNFSDFDDFSSINRRLNVNAACETTSNSNDSVHDNVLTNGYKGFLTDFVPEATMENIAHSPQCSSECYNAVQLMGSVNVHWDLPTMERFNYFAPLYCNTPLGPCTLSRILGAPCHEVHSQLLEVQASYEDYDHKKRGSDVVIGPKKTNAKRSINDWLRTRTAEVHKRSTFHPCNHLGPCTEKNCSCVREKIACEPSCYCSKDCHRRFPGCTCAAKGKPCFASTTCECYRLNRECNPDLCGTCGVVDVLDPTNRHDDEIAKGRCHNCHVQRNKPKKTYLGNSQVAGFGLFVGEAICKNEYIGEYKGEIISRSEEKRRGTLYHYQHTEFLFDLNASQFIDATYAGNKMRYINHSSSARFQNCYTKPLFCGVDLRIGIFAKRDLKIGEELFFPYGPGYDKRTKHFREIDGTICQPEKVTMVVKTKKPKKSGSNNGTLRKVNNAATSTAVALAAMNGPRASSAELQKMLLDEDTTHDADKEDQEDSDESTIARGRLRKRLQPSPKRQSQTSSTKMKDTAAPGEDDELSFSAESGSESESESDADEELSSTGDESYHERAATRSLSQRASQRGRDSSNRDSASQRVYSSRPVNVSTSNKKARRVEDSTSESSRPLKTGSRTHLTQVKGAIRGAKGGRRRAASSSSPAARNSVADSSIATASFERTEDEDNSTNNVTTTSTGRLHEKKKKKKRQRSSTTATTPERLPRKRNTRSHKKRSFERNGKENRDKSADAMDE